MVLTLYKLDSCPPVRAVYMVIEALQIPDVKYVEVNTLEGAHLTEEYRKLNPQHTVPLLKDDDFLLWDSHAIIGYLIAKYGNNDSLYPSSPKERAMVDQKLHFDSGILFPSLRSTCEPVVYWGEPAFKPENLQKIKNAYQFMEDFLTSTWLAGDKVTVADICCVATVSSLNEVVPIDENLYPKLLAWLQRCSKEEYYKKANVPGLLDFRRLVRSKLGLE